MEGSVVDGGVLIIHQLNDGKHQYEVKSVFKHQKKKGEKHFLRRGDRLRLVNDTDTQDVQPEELAQILSKGNPKLTVHKTLKKKEPVVVNPEDKDVMVPVSKEQMILCFGQEMIRQDILEEDSLLPTGGDEDDVCTEKGEEDQRDFLLVSMKKTTVSVIKGRSCDPKEPCHECKVKCEYNDIVMVTESSTVTRVPRGGSATFRHMRTEEAVVEHGSSSTFIRSLCSEKRLYVSPSFPPQNERITIYYYKSTSIPKGIPVVLNFTGSDCFLKCCMNAENKVELHTEVCEKQRLKSISVHDQQTLSYVFYMKSEVTRNISFESARYRGWFIQVSQPDSGQCEVNVVKREQPQAEEFFYILIQTQRA